MKPLGKRAIITGAVGAIGSAIARAFVSNGTKVLLVDVAAAPLGLLARDLGKAATACHLDLADTHALTAWSMELLHRFGPVDILINNAGVLSSSKIADTSTEEWSRVNTINLDAAFLLTKAVLPGMRANKWGRVINMSSYAAKSGGLTAGTAYSVSKAAMIGLTFAVARETAHEGITCNAVAPAYVMSPMVSEQLSAAQRERQLQQIPVGRFCEPEEVAHAVSFLASPLAGFITGEVIDMNGGLHFD